MAPPATQSDIDTDTESEADADAAPPPVVIPAAAPQIGSWFSDGQVVRDEDLTPAPAPAPTGRITRRKSVVKAANVNTMVGGGANGSAKKNPTKGASKSVRRNTMVNQTGSLMNMVMGTTPTNEPIDEEDKMLFRCILQAAVDMVDKNSDGSVDLEGEPGYLRYSLPPSLLILFLSHSLPASFP